MATKCMFTEVCPDSGRTEKVMVDLDKKKIWIEREGESKIETSKPDDKPAPPPERDAFDEFVGW